MPKLPDPKEETLAQTYVNHPEKKFNKTQSFLEVNPNSSYDCARVNASKTFAKDSIKNRIAELLDKQGLSLERLNEKTSELMNHAKSEDVQFKATRLGYELHGALDRSSGDGASSAPLAININILSIDESANKPTT